MKIAIIPARGGSKRIPRKNIREFCGKPMIAYAIDAALGAGLFERVVVSTDDEEIREIAVAAGAVAPFIRPAELADDHTPTVPVIAHAITACNDLGWEIDFACCIYPGVPLIEISDLTKAYDLLMSGHVEYSFPIAEFPSAIQRALHRQTDGRMRPIFPQYELTRTQDLEPAYYDAGQFYWGKVSAWLSGKNIHSNGAGLPISSRRVVDIDTPEDWERAELLYKLTCKEA